MGTSYLRHAIANHLLSFDMCEVVLIVIMFIFSMAHATLHMSNWFGCLKWEVPTPTQEFF